MEKKIAWNLYVYQSVAKEFDETIQRNFRGEKGTTISAACLMFLLATPGQRQLMVDLIKLAEGRGHAGTIVQAAELALRDQREENRAVRDGWKEIVEAAEKDQDAVAPHKRKHV